MSASKTKTTQQHLQDAVESLGKALEGYEKGEADLFQEFGEVHQRLRELTKRLRNAYIIHAYEDCKQSVYDIAVTFGVSHSNITGVVNHVSHSSQDEEGYDPNL